MRPQSVCACLQLFLPAAAGLTSVRGLKRRTMLRRTVAHPQMRMVCAGDVWAVYCASNMVGHELSASVMVRGQGE